MAKNDERPVGDVLDKSASRNIHLADLGTSLTSHGDGSPSISEDYVEARKADAERNADVDRVNRELARGLGRKDV